MTPRDPDRLRFAILCLGRTGSSHLVSQLDHHSQASCFSEIFGDGKPPTFASSGEADPRLFADALLAGAPGRAVGFKLPLSSLHRHPDAASVLRDDQRMRVIRLSRRNRLAQLVSRRLFAKTGVSQSIFGEYGEAAVRIEPRECLAAFERMDAEERELDELAAGHDCFRLDYEELVAGAREEELQRWLGLDPEPLRSWFTKLRTRPLAETIENWEELSAALRRAGYGAYLDEAS